ncbi:hypothetical protein NDU88_002287, partial [Pleurodeles waltl]
TAEPHPVCDVLHTILQVGLCAGGVLGEGEYKLSVVGVGGDDDAVLAYDVGEGA